MLKQLRNAGAAALGGGIIFGGLLILWIFAMEHSDFLFLPSGSRFYMIAILPALFAVIFFLYLLLFALAAAGLEQFWAGTPGTSRIYFLFIAISVAALFAYFWVDFRIVRQQAFPFSVKVAALLLTLIALISLWALNKVHSQRPPFLSKRTVTVALGVCLLITVSFFWAAKNRIQWKKNELPNFGPIYMGLDRKEIKTVNREGDPSIILVSIDTLRADHVSSYDYPKPTSPNIDALAQQGILFRNAYAQSPWTLPSHATMFTSLYSSVHQARMASVRVPVLTRLPNRFTTIAEILAKNGFHTAAFVASFYLGPDSNLQQGFQQFDRNQNLTASAITDKGIAWIEKQESSPYFLLLHFLDVHQYRSPPEFQKKFQTSAYGGKLKKKFKPEFGYYSLSDDDLRFVISKYDSALNFVDAQLGRLFEYLKSSGRFDHTLIVITSDHGEEFWDHGNVAHGWTLYEEMLRVPLILKPPLDQRSSKQTIESRVGLIDLAPTILDYAGIPPFSEFRGVSLKSFILDDTHQDRMLFAEDTLNLNSYAILRKDYKYIENNLPPPVSPLDFRLLLLNFRGFYRFKAPEIYNIRSDAAEKMNLIANHSDEFLTMRKDLLDHLRNAETPAFEDLDKSSREEIEALGYVQ